MPTYSSILSTSADTDNLQQNTKISKIYNIYRLSLALILLISYYYRTPNSPLGSINQEFFVRIEAFYLLINLLLLTMSFWGTITNVRIRFICSFGTVIFDILLLATLSYTCGGVSSGMAHLLLVPVAAGSILFGTRLGIFFAAIGSIAAIYSEAYLSFSISSYENYYVQAGLLGLLLFITSLGLQYLGHRIRQKELINRQQAASIHSLQQINQQVIQRMQTGIVVVTREGDILLNNSSARKLLALDELHVELTPQQIPAALKQQLQQWLDKPEQNTPPIQIGPGSPDILANYSFLQTEVEPNILIFLEDYTQISSRAQHLKLMSLGRLSASIAHEIRNPLGAISHACQLLEESEQFPEQEKRLLSIINTHTQRVNSIIESILEHSRQRNHLAELVSLKPWLEQFVYRFSSSYSHPIQCELNILDEGLLAYFNPSQLEQLLTNLSDNAQRYSGIHTGNPKVKIVAYLNPQNLCPVIDVIDDGPGVADHEAEQIFEPFYTTESKGTGLGLFICKEICEANRALLFYCRNNDGESCFRIQFAKPEQNIS